MVNWIFFYRHWRHRWECWTTGWASTDVKTRGWPMSSPTSRRSTWVRKSSTGDIGAGLTLLLWDRWTVALILHVFSQNRASTRLQADQLEALPPLNNRSNFTGGGFRVENPMRRWCPIKSPPGISVQLNWSPDPSCFLFQSWYSFFVVKFELQAWVDMFVVT